MLWLKVYGFSNHLETSLNECCTQSQEDLVILNEREESMCNMPKKISLCTSFQSK